MKINLYYTITEITLLSNVHALSPDCAVFYSAVPSPNQPFLENTA